MPQTINGIQPKSSIPDEPAKATTSGLGFFSSWLDNQRYSDQATYQGVPTYWSSYRDDWLREQYESISFVNAVVSNITKKLSSIIPIIQPIDPDNDQSQEIAEIETELLQASWVNVAEQILTDLMTQDNGVFIEVMGSGEADQPIEATMLENGLSIGATGLRHLDSGRCTRTGDNEFPVIYESEIDGKRYKLHYTRIIYYADQPSPRADLYGVGLCGLSRFIDEALAIEDVTILEREMYGSKPPMQLALGVDLPPEEVQKALSYARQQALDKQLSRYVETPWIIAQGAPAGTKASDLIHLLTLKHLPENWDKTSEYELASRLAALAFGVDTGEFWRGNTVGQTKADAQIQDEKGAKKFEAWFFSTMEQWLKGYYCSQLTAPTFDREDDTQDKAQADIAKINAETYKLNLESGVLSHEIIWQQMLERQEINQAQYDLLLANQSPVEDEEQKSILKFEAGEQIEPLKWKRLESGVVKVDFIFNNRMLSSSHAWDEDTIFIDRKGDAFISKDGKFEVYHKHNDKGLYTIVDVIDDIPIFIRSDIARNNAKKKDLADDYQFEVDRLVEQALNNEISQAEFEVQMTNLIDEFGEAAFMEGIDLDEGETLSEDEQAFLDEKLAVILLALMAFSKAIYDGEYTGREQSAFSRAELWGNSINEIVTSGKVWNRSNPLLRWQVTPGKDHCADCGTFDGQIKTATEWRNGRLLPQSIDLECHGFNCGCSLVEV